MTQNILGTWELARFEITANDGSVMKWGPNPRGQLIYTDDGHMSVAINRDPQPADSEAQSILNSILFYAGTYAVDGDIIRHKVTLASNPERVGRDMVRYAEIHGDEIHLKTPKETYGVANLVWRRVK